MQIRLTGTLTAVTPMLITRPEQKENLLTTIVIRNEMAQRSHVIPGETLKGMMRSTAYHVCVDGARLLNPKLKVDLDQFYAQTAGGMSFKAEDRDLGNDEKLREGDPLLSLYGAASPKITGRIIVQSALGRPVIGTSEPLGLGLPPGTRRDALLVDPDLAGLLTDADKTRWAKQAGLTSAASEASRKEQDAERILARARKAKLGEEDIAVLQKSYEEAVERTKLFKEDPDFQHAIQRPIPIKQAAPAGTVYDHRIEVPNATDEEIGLLFATLQVWNQLPRLGGGRTAGYGRLQASYILEIMSEEPLRRLRSYEPAGTVSIGVDGESYLTSKHPAVLRALKAWEKTEGDILSRTRIFTGNAS